MYYIYIYVINGCLDGFSPSKAATAWVEHYVRYYVGEWQRKAQGRLQRSAGSNEIEAECCTSRAVVFMW